MIVALIDNGSLEPAAHLNLRTVARALAARVGVPVHAVSWKHSDRITPELLGDAPAWTLAPFVRAMTALGQREFVFVPFFISPQGAIGSALRSDLETLQRERAAGLSLPFEFSFTDGLATRGVIPQIVADRIRACVKTHALNAPPVILTDHGGPSATSAKLRDELAAATREILGREIGSLVAASMEGAHPPLLVDTLRGSNYDRRAVVVAPLFLSPGRHAGPDGDVAGICRAPEVLARGTRCHLTDLVGSHPVVIDTLAAALRDTLSTLHAQPFA